MVAVNDNDRWMRSRGDHWLRERCYACGHRLAFAATACPQCNEQFDGRKDPKKFPAKCQCKRCEG